MKRINLLLSLLITLALLFPTSRSFGTVKDYTDFPEVTTPTSDDIVPIWEITGGKTSKVTLANFSKGLVGIDEAYGSGWNADTGLAEKDDIYDWGHGFDTDDDGSLADEAWLTGSYQPLDADLTSYATPTAWRMFYSDAADPFHSEIVLGADGTFLESNGASAAPAFRTLVDGDIPTTLTLETISGTPAITNGVAIGTDQDANKIDDSTTGAASTQLFIGNEYIVASGDIGAAVQAYHAALASIVGLTEADVSIIEQTGADTYNVVTSGGNNYILGSESDNSVLEFKTPAEVLSEIGAQPLDTDLTTLATPTAWRMFYSDAADAFIQEIVLGADGTFLESNGASAAPAFRVLAAADIPSIHSSQEIDSNTKSFIINAATTADDFLLWRTNVDITITDIYGVLLSGTNVVGGLDEMDANGANAVAVDADITFNGSLDQDDGSLTNGGIDAGDWIHWHTTSVSSPGYLTITINYTID